MKKALRLTGWIVFALALFSGILILIATFSDFKPEKVTTLKVYESPDILPEYSELNIMIWNIGYSGLDASMDFFYDGGTQVRPPRENVERNLDSISSFLRSNDSVDFFLLQEVDISSKRSYGINQFESISSLYPNYESFKGINYDVFFVPLPPAKPMGRVLSGLQTLSRFKPEEASRYSFPGNYPWPKNLFMLDRCFLVTRFPLSNGKSLLVVNTHNSAYDDGSLRSLQMDYLKNFLLREHTRGSYIIIGGDWNQSPPGLHKEFEGHIFDNDNYTEIPPDYPEKDWQWVWDESFPTNRRVSKVYSKGNTPVTLIDFFLLSPEIEVLDIKTSDLNFTYSDHQPVILKIRLK